MQKASSNDERKERRLPYRAARSALNKAIRLSKKACLYDLYRKANENPWGNPYKVAMQMIIETLFPMHEPAVWPPTPYTVQDVRDEEIRVTNGELIAVAKDLPSKRAPGPDGIPNVTLKAAIGKNPDMIRTTIQHCI